MTLYQRLQRRFARYAIPNLANYICGMFVIGFAILLMYPELYVTHLSLNPEAIFRGQVWRLFTFLLYYPSTNLIFAMLGIFIYYHLGETLERVWGTFNFNLFFFMGVLFYIVTSLLTYLLTGLSLELYPNYLSFSIFLAYALSFPEATFFLYFLIPIKAKYLALVEVALYLWSLFGYLREAFSLFSYIGSNELARLYFSYQLSGAASILISLATVGIFFLMVRSGSKRRRGKTIDIRNFR